jgi:hypothetical protein
VVLALCTPSIERKAARSALSWFFGGSDRGLVRGPNNFRHDTPVANDLRYLSGLLRIRELHISRFENQVASDLVARGAG